MLPHYVTSISFVRVTNASGNCGLYCCAGAAEITITILKHRKNNVYY